MFELLSIFAARRLITNKHATWIIVKMNLWNRILATHYIHNGNQIPLCMLLIAVLIFFFAQCSIQCNYQYIQSLYFMSRDSMKELSLNLIMTIYTMTQTHATNGLEANYWIMQLYQTKAQLFKFVKQIIRISFKYREQFDDAHPEYHINKDARWYQ